MRVCYFGTYDRDYCRNQILQRGLRLAGAEVVECHCEVWRTRDKSQLRGAGAVLRTLASLASSRKCLRRKFARIPPADAIIVGYLGHFDVGVARRVAAQRPVVFDAFMSLYETVVEDRRIVTRRNPVAAWLKRVDRTACQMADLVLLDTQAHIDYFVSEIGVPREKLARIFVGADDRVFRPREHRGPGSGRRRILFYGKMIPLHGVEHIVRAAHILSTRGEYDFEIIGTGQTYRDARRLADELNVSNIAWADWVNYEELPDRTAAADVCLGIFGSRGKALRVVPNKVFQALACGVPVITADTPAIRELGDLGAQLVTVPPGDAEALAAAIETTCQSRPTGADAALLQRFTPKPLGQRVHALIEELLVRSG